MAAPSTSPSVDIPAPTPPDLRAQRRVAVGVDVPGIRAQIDEMLVELLLWHGWRFERDAPWTDIVTLRPPPTHPRADEIVTQRSSVTVTWRNRGNVRVPTWAVD